MEKQAKRKYSAYSIWDLICFVNQIVEHVVHNGLMKDISVLQEAPFTNQGSVLELYTDLSL